MPTKAQFMARDQYGQTFHGLTHPRKELMERLGVKHASKMYVDRNGSSVHIGYVIGQHWLTLYEVRPFERIN